MRTIEKKVYTFDELSDEAKSRALDWMRDCNAEDWDWRDSCFYDFDEVAEILGIEFQGGSSYKPGAINYSGFWSQGDGLSFSASYSYRPGAPKAIREYAPLDKDLHAIADGLQKIQRPFFYQLTGNISHSRYGRNCITTSLDCGAWPDRALPEDEFDELMRDFASWMYRQLRNDYEYRTSDEACEEDIKANEYEFDEEGHIG